MTRIIAGFARSVPLAVPASGTRPTSDRVREAVFSSLDARGALSGARVLDLYCGSGALGLEAASRGAAEVALVDRVAAAYRATVDNAARVRAAAGPGESPRIAVSSRSVRSFLDAAPSTPWDVVFLDPPYDLPAAELVGDLEALVGLLAEDAVVVVERSARDPEPAWPRGIELERRADYGQTSVYYLGVYPDAPSQSA